MRAEVVGEELLEPVVVGQAEAFLDDLLREDVLRVECARLENFSFIYFHFLQRIEKESDDC